MMLHPNRLGREGLVFEWQAKSMSKADQCSGNAYTFTNSDATNRWYLDPADGIYKAAAANQPRFVADGLLLDGLAATNLIYPAIPDAVSWSNYGLSATPLATGKADSAGGPAAIAIKEDGNNSAHYIGSIQVAAVQNDFFAASAFVKAGTRGWAYIQVSSVGLGFVRAYVNLATGALGTVEDDGSGTVTYVAVLPPQEYPNGWWRIGVIGKLVDAGTAFAQVFAGSASADATLSYLGVDGDEAIEVWRCQLEKTFYVTESIPTTTGTGARGSEVVGYTFGVSAALLAAISAGGSWTCISEVRPRVALPAIALPGGMYSRIVRLSTTPASYMITVALSVAPAWLVGINDGADTTTNNFDSAPAYNERVLLATDAAAGCVKRARSALSGGSLDSTVGNAYDGAMDTLTTFNTSIVSPFCIKSIFIYNRILTDAEILAHWSM